MDLIMEKKVTKKMFFDFMKHFFDSWEKDEDADKKAENKEFLKFLPKNVMWELKPLAEKQYEKVVKAAEGGKENQFTEIFDDLAIELAHNYWEQDLKEVNRNKLPNFAFCQLAYERAVVANDDWPTFSRLLFGILTEVFNIHPDPFVD